MPRTGWPGGRRTEIAPEVLFYIQMRPDMLHLFDPQSREKAFLLPSDVGDGFQHREPAERPRSVNDRTRAVFRGTVGEAAAVEFSAFLKVWRELPHPRAVIDDPENAAVPDNASALIALCGSLYRMADDINLGAIVTYATRLRRENRRVSSSVPASGATRTCSARPPSSAGPPPAPSDTAILGDRHHGPHPRRHAGQSLRISAWSGRLYDRKASNHVAVHHEASASAGRYNKCLLPKAAFAALNGHHEQGPSRVRITNRRFRGTIREAAC